VAAALVLSAASRAMDIKDYFKIATEDKARFSKSLLDTAEKTLRDQGHPDSAQQLHELFTKVPQGDEISQGVREYNQNLVDMLRSEIKREARNPDVPHLQAERAFRDVASDHGITLPPEFESAMAGFHREHPLQKLTAK
jgi:hypothetical protein